MASKELSKKRKAAPTTDHVEKKKLNGKPATKPQPTTAALNDEVEDLIPSEADETIDAEAEADRTAVLLKGFESSSGEDEEQQDASTSTPASNAIPTADIPHIPSIPSISLSKTSQDNNDPPVILYIGHIPHGFYEPQMRSYFSQFGTISHLRLSRNKKTGKPKHYAFVSFASGHVGRIVQETMDNYLLMGHVLKVKIIDGERATELVEKGLWKGEGRRWKVVPRGRIENGSLKSAGRGEWEGRVRKERRRRRGKAEMLKALGYEFDVGKVRSVGTVPRKGGNAVDGEEMETQAGAEGEFKMIEAAAEGRSNMEKLLAAQGVAKEGAGEKARVKTTVKQKKLDRKIAATKET